MKYKKLIDILRAEGYSIPASPEITLRGNGPSYHRDLFVVNPLVQRECDTKRSANKIAPNFQESMMKVPSAFIDVDEDGNDVLGVYDGQHTVLALILRGVTHIPAYALNFLSTTPADKDKEMFKAFVGLNTSQVKVSTYDIHKGNVAIGDPLACAIDATATRNGAILLNSAPATRAGAITKVKLFYTIHEQFNKYIDEAIRDILTIWPGYKIEGTILHGYARLLRELYKQYGHRNHMPVIAIQNAMYAKSIPTSMFAWDIIREDYIRVGKTSPIFTGVGGMDVAAGIALITNEHNTPVCINNLKV